MSKIKVDDIAPSSSNTPSITLGTNSNVSFANGVTATSFTGNGANLTNLPVDLTQLSATNLTSGTIPDARFPATLPAVSGANLTGVGGGSLEFVDKLETSTAVTSLTKTGLEYDKLYRISIPEIVYSAGTYLDIAPIVDNNTTPANASDCSFINHIGVTGRGSSSYSGSWSYWRVNLGGWQTGPYGAFFDFYASDKSYIIGHYVVLSSGIIWYQHGTIFGTKSLQNNTNNDPNQTGSYAKVNGFKIYNANGYNINSGRVLIHKYKES